jgi:hypothetical protein
MGLLEQRGVIADSSSWATWQHENVLRCRNGAEQRLAQSRLRFQHQTPAHTRAQPAGNGVVVSCKA